MTSPHRVVKVLATLLFSMTTVGTILIALTGQPIAAGVYSLTSYRTLNSIKNVISSRSPQAENNWNSIEIYYYDTSKIENESSLQEVSSFEGIEYHFCVYNGSNDNNGRIQKSEKWQKQISIPSTGTQLGNNETIRICIIVGGTTATNYQVNRTEELVERLSTRFNIAPDSVYISR
jgi:hypothetical protein